MRKVTVYGLARPGGPVRYIGQTINGMRRMIGHRRDARTGSKLPVHRWMRKNSDVEMIVLIEDAIWNDDEIRLIKESKTPLLNCTIGGNNRLGPGIPHSSNSKMKIAKTLSVLSENDLDLVRSLKSDGLSYRQIAERLGVSHNTIRNVIIGRTYT